MNKLIKGILLAIIVISGVTIGQDALFVTHTAKNIIQQIYGAILLLCTLVCVCTLYLELCFDKIKKQENEQKD